METNKTLKDLKIGDKVWTIQEGWTLITRNRNGSNYPLVTSGRTYTIEGKTSVGNKHPSLFLYNPLEEQKSEQQTFQPKWMMVSNDNVNFVRRYVFALENGFYISWCLVEDELKLIAMLNKEKQPYNPDVSSWLFAKDISERIELTMEQIAEKFGIPIEQLKIKK